MKVNDLEGKRQPTMDNSIDRLFFGVDSKARADNILQNNLTQFEWVVRNKTHPNFWCRNINGENCLTKEEIKFIHNQGSKIGFMCLDNAEKATIPQGDFFANSMLDILNDLKIPNGVALFLEVNDTDIVSTEYMFGYAQKLLSNGFVPGFKANTDAKYPFDREFSRGIKYEKEIFGKCIVWATAPIIAEYDEITTTHLVHPENWVPFAPSGITRNDIAIWQYGKKCHSINDNLNKKTFFNVDLASNLKIIEHYMF